MLSHRLAAIEESLNRGLEILDEVVVLDDISTHIKITDEEFGIIQTRVRSLERKVRTLLYKTRLLEKQRRNDKD